ncbi:hypothetical protein FA95DRAFT_1613426 [Auriscalpium vulgare]|uniref:Uncharacterized protein n=2 Tax=Auriscalpium vulgare TaxID=40419 RepID=A0ACB8R389_9AGAM|nr:hypothetical protein FA95DRAFT_1613426 [Auriscalpium vulgare]
MDDPPEDAAIDLPDDPFGESFEHWISDADMPPRKRRRTTTTRRRKKNRLALLTEWLPFRDTYMDELVRHDGRGDFMGVTECTVAACESPWTSRCLDCFGSPLLCDHCLCEAHTRQPIHRVQTWNGRHFEKHSLLDAGLCLQLGHDDRTCPNPRQSSTKLTVVDTSGIHTVAVRFCDCGTAPTYVQLLRVRWWPATMKRPRTAITLRTCELFHALTLQGKMNAYDFWHGLARITDGTGLKPAKNHYKDFIRVMRCFRNVRMAKRGGRGHDPAGIAATSIGELVVECPACPQPGRNMPDGWEDAPKDEK